MAPIMIVSMAFVLVAITITPLNIVHGACIGQNSRPANSSSTPATRTRISIDTETAAGILSLATPFSQSPVYGLINNAGTAASVEPSSDTPDSFLSGLGSPNSAGIPSYGSPISSGGTPTSQPPSTGTAASILPGLGSPSSEEKPCDGISGTPASQAPSAQSGFPNFGTPASVEPSSGTAAVLELSSITPESFLPGFRSPNSASVPSYGSPISSGGTPTSQSPSTGTPASILPGLGSSNNVYVPSYGSPPNRSGGTPTSQSPSTGTPASILPGLGTPSSAEKPCDGISGTPSSQVPIAGTPASGSYGGSPVTQTPSSETFNFGSSKSDGTPVLDSTNSRSKPELV